MSTPLIEINSPLRVGAEAGIATHLDTPYNVASKSYQNAFDRARNRRMEDFKMGLLQQEREEHAKKAIEELESIKIRNDVEQYKLDRSRRVNNQIAIDLPKLQEITDSMSKEIGQTDFNSAFKAQQSTAGLSDPFNPTQPFQQSPQLLKRSRTEARKAMLAMNQAKLTQLSSQYAHVLNDPVHGPAAQQAIIQVQNAMLPFAEGIQGDYKADYNDALQELKQGASISDPAAREQYYHEIRVKYDDLWTDPQFGVKIKPHADFFRERTEIIQKSLTTKQEQEFKLNEATAKAERDANSELSISRNIKNTKDVLREKATYLSTTQNLDKVEIIRKAIADGDFNPGGIIGGIREWAWRFIVGRGTSQLTADQLKNAEWVDLVSELSGALSDAEGAKLSQGIPDDKAGKDTWLNWLDQLHRSLSLKQQSSKLLVDRFGPGYGVSLDPDPDQGETLESGLDLFNRNNQ